MQTKPITDAGSLGAAVQIGITVESHVLEFKALYVFEKANPPLQDEQKKLDHHRRELAKDVASLANTFGGSILVGVTEDTGKELYKRATAFVGVQNAEGLRAWVAETTARWLWPQPVVSSVPIPFAGVAQPIVALNVRPHLLGLVAVREPGKDEQRFPARTDFGVSFLEPREVALRMSTSNRAAFILFHEYVRQGTRVILASAYLKRRRRTPEEVAVIMAARNTVSGRILTENALAQGSIIDADDEHGRAEFRVSGLTAHQFQLSLGAHAVDIPMGCVTDVWRIGAPEHNLVGLSLTCTLIYETVDREVLYLRT